MRDAFAFSFCAILSLTRVYVGGGSCWGGKGGILTAEVRKVKYLMSDYYVRKVISSQMFDQLLGKWRAGYLISGWEVCVLGGTRIKAFKNLFWKKDISPRE